MSETCRCHAPDTLKEMMHVVMAQQCALRVALTSILRTHPDAEAALAYFDYIAETLKANFLNSQWSEERLDDFEFHLNSLRSDLAHQKVLSEP